jgi:hypothetical protein
VKRLQTRSQGDAESECVFVWVFTFGTNNISHHTIILYRIVSAFRPRGGGVSGSTSKNVAACLSPDGLRETEHEGGGEPRLVLSYARMGALVVGVTSVREGERESRATTLLCMRALDLPFIDARRGSRCTMGV